MTRQFILGALVAGSLATAAFADPAPANTMAPHDTMAPATNGMAPHDTMTGKNHHKKKLTTTNAMAPAGGGMGGSH
jgi:hypothetical protein